MEEILKQQLVIQGRALATFLQLRKLSRTARKAFAGRMQSAGRMLCRPALKISFDGKMFGNAERSALQKNKQ